jgi:hypothetical protein
MGKCTMLITKTGIDGDRCISPLLYPCSSYHLSRCEYIFYRGLYRTAYVRVSRGVVTDTELQIAQFVLPRHGFGVTNETAAARTLRSFKEDLPEDHVSHASIIPWRRPDRHLQWFPMEYYGNERGGGKNSHYYHVFFT